MKKSLFCLLSIMFAVSVFSVNLLANEPHIIPRPKSLTVLAEKFELNSKTKIVANDAGTRQLASFLNDYLQKTYGFKLDVVNGKKSARNAIVFDGETKAGVPPGEAYGLSVRKAGARIFAQSDIGFFYGLQSFLQLLPAEFSGKTQIQGVEISDEPRFRYRGMHLDVSRHFFSVDFVKKYIDLMAQYKLNYFHWHLTDDQGWRIEIKKYPKLTEIGSKRQESHLGPYTTNFTGDGIPVEGFYTQEQIKEVVAYAKSRFITVVPEIELPGHSSAALAAYPEFGCKKNYEYKVQQTWGIFKEVFCPTEVTFKFLEDVLRETIALFPDSPYIHIGGDEVLKDFWKESPEVQALMKRENLKDEHEVQSYFIRRMEKFINSKGKQIIGWDEILEGGLAPNAVVMSWRGEKGGIEAAKSKHDVIMTPTNFLYFDYGQGNPQYEPINIGNQVSLETVYNYNPIPKELTPEEAKYVLGAQGNVWTEYMKTPEKVEYMVFPRILALAEINWTSFERKDFADFQRRMPAHYGRLDKQNVNYRIPEPFGLRNQILTATDKAEINLISPVTNGKIFYTLDGATPDENSKLYEKPFELTPKDNEPVELKVVVVNANKRKSVPYTATFMRRAPLKAVELAEKISGVNYTLFTPNQNIKSEQNTSKSIQLPQFSGKTNKFTDSFSVEFTGYIYAPETAIYEFQIEADDSANLEIGNENVIKIEFSEGKKITKYGIAPLEKGFHTFKMNYSQDKDTAILNLRWGIKGTGLRRIYGNELFR